MRLTLGSRRRRDMPSALTRARDLTRVFARFGPMLAPYWKRMTAAAACMLGFIATSLMAPWPIQMVIDGVLLERRDHGMLAWIGSMLPQDRTDLLLFCSLAVVFLAVVQGYCSYGQAILAASVGHRVVADLRVAVFAKLQRLSLAFHSKSRTGDLLVRMTGDVSMLRQVLVPAALDSASRILVLSGMLTLMVLMDAWLTLVAVAMLPLLGLATVRFGSRIRTVAKKQRRKEGKVATVAGEALASVALVQAYSREDAVAEQFTKQNKRSLRAGLKALRLSESLSRIVELTLAVGTSLVLWFGVRRAMQGSMSPGELIVFLAYLKGIYKPIRALVRTAGRVSKAIACGERVLEVLDSDEEVRDRPDAVPAPPLRGEIVFDRVTFGYDPNRPVLHDISFRVAPGEKVGLVGPSGSGKSTLLSLLLRLHEPQQGRILVDGQDIRNFKLESYRRQIAVVLQEPFLMGVTVEENIGSGRSDATFDEILHAARAAEAHGFIDALPEGYDTVLGERGTSLSRGQQQRLALARAILREAPVLVFDEPTTGLDHRTENEVIETLSRLGQDRTCMWIAHGPNQILGCPRAIVIRDGRIDQDGRPSTLLARTGTFQSLFEKA